MISTYPAHPLSELAKRIDYGLTASATDRPVGPKFLRITDIVPEQLDWASVPFCAIPVGQSAEKYALSSGDIVIARTGATVGYSKRIQSAIDAVFASYLVRVRVSDECDPAYVGYVVGSDDYKDFVRSNAGGAAQPNANARVLTSYEVPLPPLHTQRKIAAILTAYDDLIENNARRVTLLEEMAQRIYREWFVDFRYPGHEDVPLVDSQFGPIPKGWRWSSLGEVAKWSSGGTPRTSVPEYWGGSIPWISSGVLTEFLIRRSDRYVTDVGARAGTRLVERDGVILVVRGMSLAKEVRMGIAERTVAFSQDCKALIALDGVDPLYLAFTLRSLSEKLLAMVEYAAHGTGLLATDRVQDITVVVPAADVQGRFTELAAYIRGEIANLTSQVTNVRATRDLLLPRLVSGEIDVSDLDIAIAEVAA